MKKIVKYAVITSYEKKHREDNETSYFDLERDAIEYADAVYSNITDKELQYWWLLSVAKIEFDFDDTSWQGQYSTEIEAIDAYLFNHELNECDKEYKVEETYIKDYLNNGERVLFFDFSVKNNGEEFMTGRARTEDEAYELFEKYCKKIFGNECELYDNGGGEFNVALYDEEGNWIKEELYTLDFKD